jgi:2-keto-4-pentenoate hydratase
MTVLDALRVQLERRDLALRDGAVHLGWKIGAAIEEVDAHTGGKPLIGYLTTATLIPHGGAFDARGTRELHAETELLIHVVSDSGVAVVGTALELVDTGRPPSSMEEIVAANVFHCAAVLGRARVGALAAGARARLWVDGELRAEAPVRAEVEATVRRVRELLDAVGERLRIGDLILAGSATHVAVAAGEAVAAEIDGVERVEVRVSRGP